ncbi:MAG TPA: beta-galactosidase, partial [Candidatus Binatia bacterium]|nr:beta-galactosidase [Candidatus Binatia bacterium]
MKAADLIVRLFRPRAWLCGLLAVMGLVLEVNAVASAADTSRERLLMDSGWKFHLGDDWGTGESLAKAGQSDGPAAARFNDVEWQNVNLPHDWAVGLPFDRNANYDHGYKPLGPGYSSNSIAWYRREFTLPKTDQGRHLWLEFDGVYRNCRVFLNGFL